MNKKTSIDELANELQTQSAAAAEKHIDNPEKTYSLEYMSNKPDSVIETYKEKLEAISLIAISEGGGVRRR